MADDRLRQLERRYRESGALADGVAWLSAARRHRSLPEQALQLAASLGDPLASAALESDEDAPLGFGRALCRYGAEGRVRYAVAYGRAHQGVLQGGPRDRVRFDALLRALEAWVVHPGADALGAVSARAAAVPVTLGRVASPLLAEAAEPGGGDRPRFIVVGGDSTGDTLPLTWASDLVVGEQRMLLAPSPQDDALISVAVRPQGGFQIWPQRRGLLLNGDPLTESRALSHGDLLGSRDGHHVLYDGVQDREWTPLGPAPQGLRAALSEELTPWVLGLGDPVRARVEARARQG